MTQSHTPDSAAPTALAAWLDRFTPMPMFALSIAYLALASGVIHRIGHGYVTFLEVHLLVWCVAASWPIFAAEALVRFFLTRRQMSFWPRFGILLAVLLFPWVRMGLRAYSDPGKIWLPRVGWQIVDRSLRRRLERFFSVPLIAFALMVLPVLALEYFWEELVRESFWLALLLDIASSLIWMAFAIEFTLSVSVAEKKLTYCVHNWVDLAVVVLPVVDFLPVLRLWQLTRLVQLNQIGKLGRLYRLRGLMLKAWRAVLLLEMLHRVMGNYKERRLKSLRDLAAAKEIELDELRQEITALDRELKREKEANAVAPAKLPQSAAESGTAE